MRPVAADTQDNTASGGEARLPDMGWKSRFRRWFWHRAIRTVTLLHMVALTAAGWIGRRPHQPAPGQGHDIMVTGRFDSDNWILAHLGPLSASEQCAHLWMVSTNPVPDMPKVTGIYPPRWLIKILGATPARLLTFAWAAVRKRPHIVGGFHLLMNGMLAAVLGRLAGAESMYFSVGGPSEVLDGGIHGESKFFVKMETPDALVEKRLIETVSACDKVITMGARAVVFLREKGADTDFHVVSGGIDAKRFASGKGDPAFDLIFIGRLAQIKRVDVLLRALKDVAERQPDVKVAIVGNGELGDELKQMARDLHVDDCVTFAGHQKDVESWLKNSRVFVLPSDSEGLSLSMMEAMMCGLPAVVSNVGDLPDLVEDGVNGFLVPRRSPRKFADRILELLADKSKLGAFSIAARHSAMRYRTDNTVALWDEILCGGRDKNDLNV